MSESRPTTGSGGPAPVRAIPSWSRSSSWWRSATAAAPSPGSTTSASCAWPALAGAAPGPAAYGRGGTEATATDANLWLGRINRDYFCGARCRPTWTRWKGHRGGGIAARRGRRRGRRGIVRIANNNMVNALKLVSVNRGFDPRGLHAGSRSAAAARCTRWRSPRSSASPRWWCRPTPRCSPPGAC